MRQLLDINTVPMKLDYNITRGQYSMHQQKASSDINITRPELEAESYPIKIKIDRREMYASMGIYMPEQFMRKTEQESKQTVLDVIGEIGEDAKAMAESKGAAFESICWRKGGYQPPEFVTAYIPSVKPEITWEGGEKTDISFSRFKMDIKWNIPLKPDIEYNRGKVDISVSQWNKVNIAYTGTNDDVIIVGKKFNFKI